MSQACATTSSGGDAAQTGPWRPGTAGCRGCSAAAAGRSGPTGSATHDPRLAGSSPSRRDQPGQERVSARLLDGDSADDLPDGDRALGAASADEGVGPVQQRLEAVLEPGEEGDVHDQPHQPAGEPDSRRPLKLTTARNRETAAMLPRSRYLNGTGLLAVQPALDRVGGVDPRLHGDLGHAGQLVQRHHVPDGEHLGVTGQRAVRAAPRSVPPGRMSAPEALASSAASGEACTPAAHTLVRDAIRSIVPSGPFTSAPKASSPVTTLLAADLHAEAFQLPAALFDNRSPKLARISLPPSNSSTRRLAPGRCAGSCASARCGPAPRSGRRSRRRSAHRRPRRRSARRCGHRGSVSVSAISNAPKIRPRSSSASSIVFIPGAQREYSSWPKYDCPAPAATIRLSYGIRPRRPVRPLAP